jgi:hypothetical protein
VNSSVRTLGLGLSLIVVGAAGIGCGPSDSRSVGPASPVVAAAGPSPTRVFPGLEPTTTVSSNPPATDTPTKPSIPATTTTPATATPTTATPATATPTTATPTTATPATATPATATTTLERSGTNISSDAAIGDPLSISIPAIGVSSALVPSGTLDDGTVAVPPDPSIAGWFTGGPKPGERGPAVIMGHVNSKKFGPGVFYRLREIPIGSVVTVGTTGDPQQFIVQSVEQYPKNQFPTEAVYGPVPQPALRLITCGGSFDSSIGHYRDNIVVFLVPAPI